jgi:ABC-type glycerol-3-phosphate transport system substrate-binding protein
MQFKKLLLVTIMVIVTTTFTWAAGRSEETSGEVTQLEFWTATDANMYEQWIAAFEAQNPDVKINLVHCTT